MSRLMLTFYDGAYGPTIRIATSLESDLVLIESLFSRMAADSSPRNLSLTRELPVRTEGIETLLLRSVRTDRIVGRKSLGLEFAAAGGPVFSWSNPAEVWQDHLERIQILRTSGGPGHQYLTDEGLDDALVEICFREPWRTK